MFRYIVMGKLTAVVAVQLLVNGEYSPVTYHCQCSTIYALFSCNRFLRRR